MRYSYPLTSYENFFIRFGYDQVVWRTCSGDLKVVDCDLADVI